MSIDRRKMLKVLPLAAMAGVPIKIAETEAKAFEMKPDKKYVFVMPEIRSEDAAQCAKVLRERGIDAVVASGDMNLTIYELG